MELKHWFLVIMVAIALTYYAWSELNRRAKRRLIKAQEDYAKAKSKNDVLCTELWLELKKMEQKIKEHKSMR